MRVNSDEVDAAAKLGPDGHDYAEAARCLLALD
jgi:hypothetical protein